MLGVAENFASIQLLAVYVFSRSGIKTCSKMKKVVSNLLHQVENIQLRILQ